ncbi:hypothetical protein [Plantibacter sp. VKM Ac-2876]|uniref:hypothetical protein n=1 Tax=Plantibacter sp. VKM Ac-2876 TaxID=2783826 RepID=UPI00188A1766|nr:hypothetical protein [Plantibacter sp. VKM Ac-2876]MBF4566332.1 hypothetical protein [Plantibacter sp. VKM Ac-2876]
MSGTDVAPTGVLQDYQWAVEAELQNTPFAVTSLPDGFQVGYDLADARWWNVLQLNEVSDSITYTVRVDERRRRFSITDTVKRMSWSAGASGFVPRLSWSFSWQSGRVRYGRVIMLGTSPGGFEIAFSPENERARIKEIGEELGLRPRMSSHVSIGLWAAAGGVAIGLIGPAIIMLSLSLTGNQ